MTAPVAGAPGQHPLAGPAAPTRALSRSRRLSGPLLLAAGLLAASVLLHLRDPHRGGSWGYCPWLVMTGTYCPGCGGLRAVNDLTHGDVAAAASSNLLLVAALPALSAWWLHTLADRWRGVSRHVPAGRQLAVAGAVLGVALLFAVARNTAGGAWLAP
jgi:uncharacterized protein DUF2752